MRCTTKESESLSNSSVQIYQQAGRRWLLNHSAFRRPHQTHALCWCDHSCRSQFSVQCFRLCGCFAAVSIFGFHPLQTVWCEASDDVMSPGFAHRVTWCWMRATLSLNSCEHVWSYIFHRVFFDLAISSFIFLSETCCTTAPADDSSHFTAFPFVSQHAGDSDGKHHHLQLIQNSPKPELNHETWAEVFSPGGHFLSKCWVWNTHTRIINNAGYCILTSACRETWWFHSDGDSKWGWRFQVTVEKYL